MIPNVWSLAPAPMLPPPLEDRVRALEQLAEATPLQARAFELLGLNPSRV